MNIAIVSCNFSYPWGGMDKLSTQMAGVALAEGHRVLLAISPRVAPHPAMQALRDAGAVLHQRSGFTQFNGRRARWRLALEHRLRHPRSLLAALDSFRPDILVLDLGGAFDFILEDGLVGWLRAQRVPFVLISHSNSDLEVLDADVAAKARATIRDAACFAFVSTHNRQLAERQIGTAIPHAVVLRNSIDRPLQRVPWPPAESARLAVVGRIEQDPKGLDVLIDSLARAYGDRAGWSVDFFGHGPDEAALRERAQARGIADRVRFLGFADDIAAIWRDHHLLLLPSRREGCARVMLEAFACGRPVLMTEVGGASDWLQPGVNGFLSPQCDVEHVTATLQEAWQARARWEEMGAAAHRTAQKLDPDPGHTLLALLQSLVSTTTHPSGPASQRRSGGVPGA